MRTVFLARAYNNLLFPHLATFFYVTLMVLLLFWGILWYITIVIINFDYNAMKNGHVFFSSLGLASEVPKLTHYGVV